MQYVNSVKDVKEEIDLHEDAKKIIFTKKMNTKI